MEATPAEAEEFSQALSARLAGWKQEDFAVAVAKESGESVSPSAVSLWTTGKNEPSRRKVFAIERVLGLKPGSLSRHLGYLPLTARDVVTVEDALEADSRISPEVRRVLLSSLEAARRR